MRKKGKEQQTGITNRNWKHRANTEENQKEHEIKPKKKQKESKIQRRLPH